MLALGKYFAMTFEELQNDSTSVRFCGQYRVQLEMVRRQSPPHIVFGYSKGHRPGLGRGAFEGAAASSGSLFAERPAAASSQLPGHPLGSCREAGCDRTRDFGHNCVERVTALKYLRLSQS